MRRRDCKSKRRSRKENYTAFFFLRFCFLKLHFFFSPLFPFLSLQELRFNSLSLLFIRERKKKERKNLPLFS